MPEKRKRLRNEEEWVKILNKVLKALQAIPGDESGNRVFTLRELLEPLGLYEHSDTISRHLSTMRVMVKGDKQPNGTYLWHIDMAKKRITANDLRKARERHTQKVYASRNIKPKKRAPKQPVKTPPAEIQPDTAVHKPVQSANDGFPDILALATDIQARLESVTENMRQLQREVASEEQILATKRATLTELEAEYARLSEVVRNATAGLMQASS